MKKTILLTTLSIGALVLAGCGGDQPLGTLLKPIIGEQAGNGLDAVQHVAKAATLGDKDENAIGESVGVSVTAQYGLVPNDKLQKYVNLIGMTIADQTPRAGGNWVFGVLNTDEVNAFSGPNGYVMITMGAVKRMKDESELAGVLAHEIAHVCLQHGLKAVKNSEGNQALVSGGKAAIKNGAESQAFGALADSGLDAITKNGYDKPSEFGADKVAIGYLIATGYDPHGLLNYLTRIEPEMKGGSFMSTHPGIDERITRVTQQITADGSPAGATLADRFASWMN